MARNKKAYDIIEVETGYKFDYCIRNIKDAEMVARTYTKAYKKDYRAIEKL